MITDADVEKLKTVFATKSELYGETSSLRVEMKTEFANVHADIADIRADIVEIRSDMSDMKEMLQGLLISMDGVVKTITDMRLEYSAMGMQLTRHEKWHHQTAGKLNMKLEY